MDWGAWQGIGTVAGVVVALVALVQSWRSGRKAHESSLEARRASTALERMAASLERREALRARSEPNPRVAWALTWHSGDAYILHNTGTTTAKNVRIEAPHGVHIVDGERRDQLGPDGQMKFIAALSLAAADDTITVHWEDEADNSFQWQRPLPPNR